MRYVEMESGLGHLVIAQLRYLLRSLLFFEIFVAEDVWRGTQQLKADARLAGIAIREVIAVDHDDFVRGAMRVVMHDFVDAGFAHGIAGIEELVVAGAFR